MLSAYDTNQRARAAHLPSSLPRSTVDVRCDNTFVSIPEPPPELMTMIRVIGQDTDLRWWLKRLVELPTNLRASEIGQLTAAMTANGEDAKLVAAFKRLVEPTVCKVVHEMVLFLYGPDPQKPDGNAQN